MKLKLELIFKDRVGIVADISALIARHGLNIVSMEVLRELNRANVYLEAEEVTPPAERRELFDILERIPDLIEIRFIETLPQEECENRFKVVLDNISDGVVAIDKNGSRHHH